jgi:hypothetical protein
VSDLCAAACAEEGQEGEEGEQEVIYGQILRIVTKDVCIEKEEGYG